MIIRARERSRLNQEPEALIGGFNLELILPALFGPEKGYVLAVEACHDAYT